ncbi:hypothetical protein CC80DRAFT_568014 [Byssothecium circinans]|uniref:Cora-domain-containing protein n=1 Tax=Byssothecium circinans TaxID=147558 RepID=A0A6A5TU27_9PLEO|nr:hypothetical protein CC80DRAFT_568014 [Byssothecium circinans]
MSLSGEELRRKYFELLNRQLCELFPSFLHNLQVQAPQEREMGRAAVLEYSKGIYSGQRVFKSSTELQEYLEETATTQARNIRQRLFLLEDLSRNYVEVLGSQLRVPPSFFGAHWDVPTAPTFNHRNPFCRFSDGGFLIRYASTQRIEIDAGSSQHSNVFSWNANVNRHIYCYNSKGPLIDQPKSYHILSFWTAGARIDDSWDSVLLVDPPIGDYVKVFPAGSLVKVNHDLDSRASSELNSLFPDFSSVQILPTNASDWGDGWLHPRYNSMFDDIVSISQVAQQRVQDPRAATEIARKLVISIFLAFLRRRYLNMLRLQARLPGDSLPFNRCDYLRDFAEGVLRSWHHDLFGFIVNVKSRMDVLIKETEENMAALGLVHSRVVADVAVPSWEQDGWDAIHESCAKLITMADMFSQSYLQFISIQEAQLANKNAMSLARITNLTMLFIPLSTIAAIFSMSDEFLPGKRKSWIFWIICFPVVFLMFALTRESRLQLKMRWISRRGMLRKHRREDRSAP